MARWCLSPVVGNGTAKTVKGSESTTGPYRLSVSSAVKDVSSLIVSKTSAAFDR